MSLPKGFKRLEYIQSSGTQFIDTKVLATIGYTATVDFQATYVPASGQSWIFAEYDKTGDWRCGLYNGSFYTSGGFTYNQTATKTARTVATGSCTKTIPYPMYLFAQSEGGAAAHLSNSQYKLYSCQIYDNGTLVRDFIPCQNTSGAVGLWDAANEVFYGNAGTGTFTAGPVVPEQVDESEITELEYIQSSGTQYIDTGVSAPEGFRIICDVVLTSISNSLNMLFGAHDTNDPYYRNFLAATNGGKWEIGAYNPHDFGSVAINIKYSIDVCTISGAVGCSVNGVNQNVDNSIAVSPARSSRTVYLFGLNYTGGLLPTNMKLYGLQMYLDANGENMVRDFVPCVTADGEVGLYDRVFHEFYRNAGTGEFIAGPEVQTVPKAPANFRVESETYTLVTLAWDPMDNVLGYRLYRQGQLLADTEETSVSVAVEPFAGAVFTLTAYNENGEGAGTSLTHFSIPDNPLLYLITDRTAQDVAERNPKGYYAASDLNRVGYAMDYLANIIRGYGYTLEVHTKTDWTDEDWKLTGEMVQYLQSLNNLKSVFSTLVELPESMERIDYQDANNIELLLLTIDETVARVVAGFTRANAFGLRSGAKSLPVSQSDRGRNWGQLDAMETTWANWQISTWYLLLYGNLKAEGVVE